MPVTSANLAADVGKFISDTLIERSTLIHRFPQFANKISLTAGMGKTAEFIKYNRTDVPTDKLVEGVTPSETPFTISRQTITVDQWGMYITLTDVGIVTTKHPVLNEALDLVADAIARTQDYQFAEVLNAGTNVQFYDGSRLSRGAITLADTFKSAVFDRARTNMNTLGVPGYSGDMFAALVGPEVEADILADPTAVTSFSAAQLAQGADKLENGKVGKWRGIELFRSNFMPRFTRIATVGAPVAATGGSLTGTVYHKVTRKNLARGFEEDIQVEASTVMSTNTRLTFTAPATAGYVYNVYAGSLTGDANMFLARENLPASTAFNLDSLPTSGQTSPATPAAGVTVHPVYIFAKNGLDWVELNELAMKGTITPAGATDSDPLSQRRKVGTKYMAKAGIRDNDRVKRIELASGF